MRRIPHIGASEKAIAARLRGLLQNAGYDETRLLDALGGQPVSRATAGARVSATRRLSVAPPLRTLIEFWYLGSTIPLDAARSTQGPTDLDDLGTLGLLHRVGDDVVPDVRIVPFGGFLVAHDLDGARRTPGDHVLGVGGATRTLAALTVRRDIRSALDLGTGSGSQALMASTHAGRVTATDLSERAAWFARLNAAMNERPMIDVHIGDAFEPVGASTFDLIVSNPPFVVSPDHAYTFRDAGGDGDSISRDVVRGAAAHLRRGGIASVLVNWIVRDEKEHDPPVLSWLTDLPCDAIVIQNESLDAARYAEQWIMDSSVLAPARYARSLDRWLRYYGRIGAQRIASGAIVLRRTDAPSRIRQLPMTAVADDGGPQLERIFASIDRFDGPDDADLAAAIFAIADDHRVDQHLTYSGPAGYAAHPVTLRLTRSAGITATVPADLLEAVFLVDGERPLAAIIEHLAEVRDLSAAELEARVMPVFLELYERGFLTLYDKDGH